MGLAYAEGMTTRNERLDALEARTNRFSLDVLRLLEQQEWSRVLMRVVDQLTDAATSVAANHRTVRRARSTREFAAKLQIVNEEVDEAVYWLETIHTHGGCRFPERLSEILREGRELRAIFATARKSTRRLL